ncbi:MAG TPA: hypothetical protein PLZ36_19100, partial [Armatimonadota bacterium]|nr:hypothetical protein [Armatimonadota bacterium]
NVAYRQADLDARHSEMYIIGYVDGHVAMTKNEVNDLYIHPKDIVWQTMLPDGTNWGTYTNGDGTGTVGSSVYGAGTQCNAVSDPYAIIPANTDGWISFVADITTGGDCLMGLSRVATRSLTQVDWHGPQYCLYYTPSTGAVDTYTASGSWHTGYTGASITGSAGTYYKIERVGSTISWKRSTDGVTYTTFNKITGGPTDALMADVLTGYVSGGNSG